MVTSCTNTNSNCIIVKKKPFYKGDKVFFLAFPDNCPQWFSRVLCAFPLRESLSLSCVTRVFDLNFNQANILLLKRLVVWQKLVVSVIKTFLQKATACLVFFYKRSFKTNGQ